MDFLNLILAEPCSPWSLMNEENVEKECEIQPTGTTCIVTCSKGFTFVDDADMPRRFICSNNIWAPSNVAPACVPIAQEPARYQIAASVQYALPTPVGSDCLKVFYIFYFLLNYKYFLLCTFMYDCLILWKNH